jgi:hypothetical protein
MGPSAKEHPGPLVRVLRDAPATPTTCPLCMTSHDQLSAIGQARVRRSAAAIGAAALLAAAFVTGGCYDGKAIIERVRSAALRNRLEEVDLGTFRLTMPRDPTTNAFAEVDLHVFGTAPRYRVQSIEKQLKTDGYRLRHETLLAVRDATLDELAEPDLTKLRNRIEQVVNHILDDAPVKSVGFYSVRITYQ